MNKKMRMNKKAQFFSIYLVILTLFMCGMVIWFYSYQQNIVANSIVSPASLLELRDNKSLFEVYEEDIIINSGKLALGLQEEFDEGRFSSNAKSEFIDSFFIEENKWMLDFLFSDLSFNGINAELEAFDEESEKRNFLNGIYDFDFRDGELRVLRNNVEKSFRLEGEDRAKINFVVDVEYIYKKDYVFSLEEFE